jgi:hypothetical protein
MHLRLPENAHVLYQRQPKGGLVCFFENDAQFGYELCAGACPASGSIVGSDRGAGTKYLPADNAGFVSFGQGTNKLDDSNCKALRPLR